MRRFLLGCTLALLAVFSQAQNPSMQAAQAAQMATQIATQAAQQAADQAMRDSQLANQNAANAAQAANAPRCTRCVARPSFSVKSGKYDSRVRVQIKAAAGDSVYYTTDGWTPTIDSNPYFGQEIVVDSTTMLQAIAVSPRGDRSRVAVAVYKFPATSAVNGVDFAEPEVISDAAAAAADEGRALLTKGTKVPLVFALDVSSKTARVGDKISLVLARDLKMGDLVAVKKGAPCTAIVTEVDQPRIMGWPGEIVFRAELLQADGATVKLRGTAAKEGLDKANEAVALAAVPVPVWLLVHGKDAEIKQGTEFTAFVDEDTLLPLTE